MSSAVAPTTAGLPNCRATSAAWLVRPPRDVRMPRAASMPCTSSGLVSGRAMMTAFFSSRLQRSAVSGSNTSTPDAAPGDTLRPLPIRSPRAAAALRAATANCGCRNQSTCSGVTRCTASARVMRRSFASATAMRTAACAVRLASRVCSIHSLPRSTVNSTSCTSRQWRSSVAHTRTSSPHTRGIACARVAIRCVTRVPATTSSPCALGSQSPSIARSPVVTSRVVRTPVAEPAPRLPNTIVWMLTAVPRSCAMPAALR